MVELLMLAALLALMLLFAPAALKRGLRVMLAMALLIALASVGRWLMASIPSVQPASALIMIAGFSVGPGAGLMVGALTALLSSLLTSLGTHTVWQMFFWGLMGFTAHKKIPLWLRPVFGFAWGFVFGWGMNLWYYSLTGAPFTWTAWLAACATSFSFDLMHASANDVLLAVFAPFAQAYTQKFLAGLTGKTITERKSIPMTFEEKATDILTSVGVLQHGHFKLTSGRHSDRYMQCARLFEYPLEAETLCAGLAEKFADEQVAVVIGPAVGAVQMAFEVSRNLKCRNMFAERVDGTLTLRRGFILAPGTRVLVVEDTVTTGGTVKEVCELVKAAGAVVVGVGCIVDRSAGKVDFGAPLRACLSMDIPSWPPEECPLCRENKPITKPGSRA